MDRLERLEPEHWERYRRIRLRALAADPDAFGSTLAREQDMGEEDWRARLASVNAATFVAAGVVAVGERGPEGDVGLITCAPYPGRDGPDGRPSAGLFSMWVAPEARGRGLGDALVEAVIAFARERGYGRMLLDVGDANAPAIALYARHGFVPTGRRGTLPPPRTHVPEHERVLALDEAAHERP